jgi:hypothetical protein
MDIPGSTTVERALRRADRRMEEAPMNSESTQAHDLVTVDLEKKRIYLHFRGTLTRATAKELRDAYAEAIAQTGPGFDAVSIFVDFVPGPTDVQEIISSMIRLADEGGCRVAVRVARGSVFGQLQLGRLHREVRAGYDVHDCETLAEAEAYLDGI